MKKTVCAVVVTFNRKLLLLRTLNALNAQTIPLDKIILVDNASTDGTYELLKEKGFIEQENLEYLPLSENTGGAGGFYAGVKVGFEQGFDWLWLMDDDGYPTDNCLGELMGYQDSFDFYGPLVLSDEDKETLSFPITLPENKKIVRNSQELSFYYNKNNNKMHDVLIPFNGVLLRRELVENIGFPDSRFFIWGDDLEYTKRAKQNGARIATIYDITFYHPTAPSLGMPMFFNKMQFNDTNSMIKLYCLCRNNTYNLKKYHSSLHALLFMIKTCWFYLFTKTSFSKLMFCLPALWHGWKADFSHHKPFIGKNF